MTVLASNLRRGGAEVLVLTRLVIRRGILRLRFVYPPLAGRRAVPVQYHRLDIAHADARRLL